MQSKARIIGGMPSLSCHTRHTPLRTCKRKGASTTRYFVWSHCNMEEANRAANFINSLM
jgi:hypothetical protein